YRGAGSYLESSYPCADPSSRGVDPSHRADDPRRRSVDASLHESRREGCRVDPLVPRDLTHVATGSVLPCGHRTWISARTMPLSCATGDDDTIVEKRAATAIITGPASQKFTREARPDIALSADLRRGRRLRRTSCTAARDAYHARASGRGAW